MNLNFNIYELKETSILYNDKIKENNEFIIVGEEELSEDYDCFKAHQLDDNGLSLIGGLDIDEFSLLIPKKDLKIKKDVGIISCELDIPKEYLTLDIIDNIRKLNS